MHENGKINYVEFPVKNFNATKKFFAQVFGWEFEDYGPDYCAFSNAGIDGGFYKANTFASVEDGSVLVVIYSLQIEQVQDAIKDAGGQICKPIFSFPGGRRFHFIEPSGNEMAVWSDEGI